LGACLVRSGKYDTAPLATSPLVPLDESTRGIELRGGSAIVASREADPCRGRLSLRRSKAPRRPVQSDPYLGAGKRRRARLGISVGERTVCRDLSQGLWWISWSVAC
jgi:hypothetical protein